MADITTSKTSNYRYIYLLQYYLLAVIIIINHFLVKLLLLKKPNETVVEWNKTYLVNYIISIYRHE